MLEKASLFALLLGTVTACVVEFPQAKDVDGAVRDASPIPQDAAPDGRAPDAALPCDARTEAQCREDCVWLSCANACFPAGTTTDEHCPQDAGPLPPCRALDERTCGPRADCAWLDCLPGCVTLGTPSEEECPPGRCNGIEALDFCNKQPTCFWYDCDQEHNCHPWGTSLDEICGFEPECEFIDVGVTCDTTAGCTWIDCVPGCFSADTDPMAVCVLSPCDDRLDWPQCEWGDGCTWFPCSNHCRDSSQLVELECPESIERCQQVTTEAGCALQNKCRWSGCLEACVDKNTTEAGLCPCNRLRPEVCRRQAPRCTLYDCGVCNEPNLPNWQVCPP